MPIWKRPVDMLRQEPTEEYIWAWIDKHDPNQIEDVNDKLEQHKEMLKGRSIYENFFSRCPLLPKQGLDPSINREPLRSWVESINLKCGEYNPLEKTVDSISYGLCEILEPATDRIEKLSTSKLLSHRQLSSRSLEWPANSQLGRPLRKARGYVSWARYILRTHKEILKAAGIYEAIYVSMFDFDNIPPAWLRGMIEFWDPTSNTCWIGAEELTITLHELQTISGLPIYGRPYEECVPPDDELFQRQPTADGNIRGEMIQPSILPIILQHYKNVFENSLTSKHSRMLLSIDVWIKSFLQKSYIDNSQISPHDPFELRKSYDKLTEELAEPSMDNELRSLRLPHIDEELFLTGFLATWLCTFVLPSKDGAIRANVLLAASLLSRGERLSLAPAVLARIFRIFRAISISESLDLQENLPWYYIQAWIHLHVQGAFSCITLPAFFIERGYPVVLQLLQATSTLEKERIRLFFFAPYLVKDRFLLVHRPKVDIIPDNITGRNLIDGIDNKGVYSVLLSGRSFRMAEQLISMRPGYLCYRSGGAVTLEGYQPNRVARQFGFSQASAYDGLPLIPGVTEIDKISKAPLNTCLYAAALTWAYLLRLGTGKIFRISHMDSHTGVSFHRLMWVKLSFSAFMERGARIYEPSVRSLGLPKYSRYSRNFAKKEKDKVQIKNPLEDVQVEPLPSNCQSKDNQDGRGTTPPINSAPSKKRIKKSSNASRDLSPPRIRRRIYKRKSSIDSAISSEKIATRHDRKSKKASRKLKGSIANKFDTIRDHEMKSSKIDVIESTLMETIEESILPIRYPSPTYCEGETSGAKSPPYMEEYEATLSELASSDSEIPCKDHPSAEAQKSEEGFDANSKDILYESEIFCRLISEFDPRNMYILTSCVTFLYNLIVMIHPSVRNFKAKFIDDANDILGFIARRGAPEETFFHVESVCRAIEYLLRWMESLSIVQTQISVATRRAHVKTCKDTIEHARHEFFWAEDILKAHMEEISALTDSFNNINARIEMIYTEFKDRTSIPVTDIEEFAYHNNKLSQELTELSWHRTKIQNELETLQNSTFLKQENRDANHHILSVAEAALTRVEEELHTAEEEYETMMEIDIYLKRLRDKL